MRAYDKKKIYRRWLKEQAKAGKYNDETGKMVMRPGTGNSMVRDYYPQQS